MFEGKAGFEQEPNRPVPVQVRVPCFSSPEKLAVASFTIVTSQPNSSANRQLTPRFFVSGCVTGEDKVASFGRLVAGEAGFVHRLVGRFAIFIKLSETPAARRGVLS